jgi:cbb3-type cytochrome oxidase subunit 3
MLELINTAITGGLLVAAIYWIFRTIRKDRHDRFNKNDTTVAVRRD